jgi:Nif-specific regulatory protein
MLYDEVTMPERIKQILSQFISDRFMQSRIHDILRNSQKSHLFEIIGGPGSGKSYLIPSIIETLKDSYETIIRYSPHSFWDNHLLDLLIRITNLDDEELRDACKGHGDISLSENKHDFFYYLSEQLSKRKTLKPCLVIIDDCDLLDIYTRDFLQYLVQYAEEAGINIISLSYSKLFPFSEVEYLQPLTLENIEHLLQKCFPEADIKYAKDSEILLNISEGSLLILTTILFELAGIRKKDLDISSYMEKRFNVDEIYLSTLSKLSDPQKKLMLYIYIMDFHTDTESLKRASSMKSVSTDLEKLQDWDLIYLLGDNWVIHKKKSFGSWMHNYSPENIEIILNKVYLYIIKAGCCFQKRARIQRYLQNYDEELFSDAAAEFRILKDNESMLSNYQYMLQFLTEPGKILNITKAIGITYSNLNQKDKAVECFRHCLQLCTSNNLPAEEIIYQLSSNLFAISSSNFALEVIKKYTPKTIDAKTKSRILLLKAEILTETEQFDDAIEALEQVIRSMTHIEDKKTRYQIQGDAKKIKGRIHYYVNEYDQAESAFKEAETMYSLASDSKGLAAIYNNLGVLYMFHGEWETSENYFIKSLNLEKDSFNLNGISVCYNNLGGLMDDKGDREKSLYYLEEALKIQKLLSEPYNITNMYNNIGVTWMNHNHFDRAEAALRKSLETAIDFNFYRNIVASLNNLGALFFKKGSWNQAIEYYEQAIHKSQENNFTEGLLRSYNNLGELYEKQGELNLAYDLYFKGLEMLPVLSDDYIKAELYGNLGSALTKLHRFKEAYSYLVESFDFFKTLNAKIKIIEGCHQQAYYFILTRNYESADYYISQSMKLATELNNQFELGRSHYLRALLERRNLVQAREHLNEAIRLFVETSNNYELSLANYELANVLNEQKEWEQALQILKNNSKIIQQFSSIKLLEQNDILAQKISRDYSSQVSDAKFEENLLNQFYEVTQKLNTISDLDVLIEQSLLSLVDISEADGGIFCLHNNPTVPESWDYKIYLEYSHDDPYYDTFMNLCRQSWSENNQMNFKQPHFAPEYNNILLIPMTVRKNALGVILLFSRHGSHYFPERMINLLNALANQVIVIIENIRATNLEKSHAIIREQLHEGNIYSNIIGKSPAMIKIFEIIEKIKDTPTSILLDGSSGTGKELIARALHYSSNRRNKAFVAQYCGALPETLLESELFGHVKGSFTGAAYDKKGLFEIADGGTFFLDEIADISLSTQAKLLRFLQEGEIKRVGATKTEKVNVRVVCATNVSLLDKVKKGDFRLDLYYRLNVIKIEVPPLSDRPGDIPLLAIFFLDKYNKRIAKNVSGFTDEAMKCLERYEWPGNVRQLENEIERAVTLVEDNTFIKSSDLSEEVYKFVENEQTIQLLKKKTALKDAIEELERKFILDVLKECNWNQTVASRELGLSRQGLIKKIKRYNLEKESGS